MARYGVSMAFYEIRMSNCDVRNDASKIARIDETNKTVSIDE